MNRIAKFEKVSKEQWMNDVGVEPEYENIKLPLRATKGSAGYDFYATRNFIIYPGDMIKLATGIRVKIDEGWVLMIMPKSGLGFKYGLRLNNTIGVIDSDYYYSDNEGHIFIKMTTYCDRPLDIKAGQGIAQGIFVPYGITVDDDTDGIRNGGFGSTETVK